MSGWIEDRTAAGRRSYRARYRDAAGRQHSKTFGQKREAQKWLRDQAVSEDAGRFVAPAGGAITLRDFFEHYYSDADLKPSSAASARSKINTHVMPALGEAKLRDINKTAIQRWLDGLGHSPATNRHAYIQLSKLLSLAVEHGLIPMNPAVGVKAPKLTTPDFRIITENQIQQMADAIEPSYRALVLLLGYAGLRFGEAIALRPQHVRPEAISVVSTITQVNGRMIEGPPKSAAGRRSVPLFPIASDALQRHLVEFPGALVFTAPDGGVIGHSNFLHRFWGPAAVKAGIEGVTPHDLRHTAISLWISLGATPKQIQSWAGHSSAAFSLQRYGHLMDDGATEVMARWEALRATR